MKINSQLKQNIDGNETQIQISAEDAEILTNTNIPFGDMLSAQLTGVNFINAGNPAENFDFDFDFDFDTVSMNLDDALFFINLAQAGQFSANINQNGQFSELIQTEVTQNVVSKRTIEVTNQLTDLIEKAMNTKKPVRISFDNNVSVIIKIDKAGKVSAEFIPGNSEVEAYLRNNIASLKQKFDEQNLPYNDLFYRQNRQNRQNKQKSKGE